jgi:integrase
MPRAPKFTDSNIKREAVPGKRLFVRDCPNLYLWTSPGPKRKQRWLLRMSRPDGSGVTERSLGSYPEVTLEMAKNRAHHARLILKRDKINPFETDWNEGATTTFEEVARKCVDSRDWTNREKQLHDTRYFLFTCPKSLLTKPLLKIRPKDIHAALESLWKRRPKQVKRALAKIEAVFDYAKANHWYFAENPARWREKQKHLFPRFSNARVNFAAMPYESMPEFMRALRQLEGGSVSAQALEFLILTAARSGEVRGMRKSELGPENLYWTIPAARMKASRDHVVPLSLRAKEIVDWRLKHTVGEYVFSAHGRNKPLDEKAMRETLRKIKPGVTVHGFRSTFKDWCGDETDFPRDLVEECLAHKVGNAVERAYRRRTGLEKRRAIMDEWAAYCDGSAT